MMAKTQSTDPPVATEADEENIEKKAASSSGPRRLASAISLIPTTQL